ncbi:hypothetical protein RIF29_38638 [Crotalaria pallida]|uniref:Bulb-type lectin domain-containing protein n=1 Tax=Crotalaria pallida TaxID=3830 RepID=A0AAN9HP49_CROPI
MLNSGNFVVQQRYPNGSKTLLWQSIDYPTDTLLPGMRLGVDKKTGKKWSLVSYTLDQVPTSGTFSLNFREGGLLDSKKNEIARADECYRSNGDRGCLRLWDFPTCRHVGESFDIIHGSGRYADNLNAVLIQMLVLSPLIARLLAGAIVIVSASPISMIT